MLCTERPRGTAACLSLPAVAPWDRPTRAPRAYRAQCRTREVSQLAPSRQFPRGLQSGNGPMCMQRGSRAAVVWQQLQFCACPTATRHGATRRDARSLRRAACHLLLRGLVRHLKHRSRTPDPLLPAGPARGTHTRSTALRLWGLRSDVASGAQRTNGRKTHPVHLAGPRLARRVADTEPKLVGEACAEGAKKVRFPNAGGPAAFGEHTRVPWCGSSQPCS